MNLSRVEDFVFSFCIFPKYRFTHLLPYQKNKSDFKISVFKSECCHNVDLKYSEICFNNIKHTSISNNNKESFISYIPGNACNTW